MLFSRSFITSVLLGYAAATTHKGEMGGMKTVAASETLASTAAAVAATNGPAAGAAAGEVATHVVQVGGPNGSLVFSPNNIKAQPGDLVQFQFMPKNHSVVQSTFDQPCKPIQDVMPNKTDAFFSGFMPNNRSATDTKNILTYTIRVMNTQPIWFYCGQAKHCQSGMVGAINAATSGNKTIEAFKAIAQVQTENLVPGQGAGSSTGGAQQSGAAGGAGGAGGAAASSAAGGAGGAAATGSSSASPAQQSTGGASGLMPQSFFGLGLGGLAAVYLL